MKPNIQFLWASVKLACLGRDEGAGEGADEGPVEAERLDIERGILYIFNNNNMNNNNNNDDEDNGDERDTNDDHNRCNLRRSSVDGHFKPIIQQGTKKRLFRAPTCLQEYSMSTSHMHLKNHWRIKHQAIAPFQSNHFMFHPEKHLDCLIKFIVKGKQKYQIVEQIEFLQFANSMNPSKKLISRHALSMLINESSVKLIHLVKIELQKTNHIALTTDIWSARKRTRSFSVITGHFLDDYMLMRNVILDFQFMPYPHDAISIKKFLVDTIKLYDLEKKLVSITSDNDSANISGIESLINDINSRLNLTGAAKVIHVRCMAHIIDLGIKEALKQLKFSVSPVEEIITTITSSTKRMERFAQVQQQLAEESEDYNWQTPKEPLKLIQDIETRWNSKYLSLNRALLLREAIDKAIHDMIELANFEPVDWIFMKDLISFLQPFHEMTERLSGENYCTMSLISSSVPILISHANIYSDNPNLSEAASNLLRKLYSYSDSLTNDVALISSILDPRIKTSFLVREERAISRIKEAIRERMMQIDPCSDILTRSDELSSPQTSNSIFDAVFLQANPDELESYLTAARELYQVNVLDYWRMNKTVYPNLFKLSQNTLSIQATSVASERVFSLAGLIDVPRRNRLSSESFHSNMLVSSWLKFLDL